jgi:hypothetical protein
MIAPDPAKTQDRCATGPGKPSYKILANIPILVKRDLHGFRLFGDGLSVKTRAKRQKSRSMSGFL